MSKDLVPSYQLDGMGEPATMRDLIRELRERLSSVEVADSSLVPFPGLPLMTHAFFPGGNGLYEGVHSTRVCTGGTLILGSNFGNVREFIDVKGQLISLDERKHSPTWKNLLPILRASGIEVGECFFTNAWPFLHSGVGNLGPVQDWLRSRALMASCLEFFRFTCSTIRPTLIVALGIGPAAFLSHVWPDQLAPWGRYALQHLDYLPKAVVELNGDQLVCVAITHPSMPNAWRRRPPYRHRSGEIGLLEEARLQAQVISRTNS